jgi:hypothetical protein
MYLHLVQSEYWLRLCPIFCLALNLSFLKIRPWALGKTQCMSWSQACSVPLAPILGSGWTLWKLHIYWRSFTLWSLQLSCSLYFCFASGHFGVLSVPEKSRLLTNPCCGMPTAPISMKPLGTVIRTVVSLLKGMWFKFDCVCPLEGKV